jgi:hypothetical protein
MQGGYMMSDQVIFTKEEVENIREFVSRFHTAGIKADAVDIRNAKYIKEILDSPRPRPKVSMELLEDCSFIDFADKESWQNAARGYALQYGFDVED